MASYTYKNSAYRMAQGAVVLTPCANSDASMVNIDVASGATIVYYSEDIISSVSEDAAAYLQSIIGYDTDGVSYRKYSLSGYNTYLGSNADCDAKPYYIYVRIDPTTKSALVCLSDTDMGSYKLDWGTKDEECDPYQEAKTDENGDPVLDDDGNPVYETFTTKSVTDYTRLKYLWQKIGTMGAYDSNTRSLTIDYGCLGSNRGVEEAISSAGGNWFYENKSDHSVDMKTYGANDDTWTFNTFVANAYHMLDLFKQKDEDNNEQPAYYDIAYILSSEDSDAFSGSELSSDANIAKDTAVPTLGFLYSPFLAWLRRLFVRKDNADGTETMQGSLVSEQDITAEGRVKGDTLQVGDGVSKSATASVYGDVDASGSINSDTHVVSPIHKSSNFSEGELTGTGVAVWEETEVINEGTDNEKKVVNGHVETDFMTVRKSAYFRELTIEEVKHIGGEMILSQAASTVARVAGYGSDGTCLFDTAGKLSTTTEQAADAAPLYYRLFFDATANGKTAYNEWRVGDQCRCWSVGGLDAAGTYTDVRTAYYWRLVINVVNDANDDGQFYIDVSNTTDTISTLDDCENLITGPGCDAGCTTPQPNDSLALLGCRNADYPSRTAAQVYSTAEVYSPSRRYYHGITQFSTADCEVEIMEWDTANAFPHWRIGDSSEYIDFSKDGLKIVAKSVKMSGSDKSMEEVAEEVAQYAQEVKEAQEAIGGDGFTVHEQTSTENFLYPTPNDYDPDGDGSYPYRTADADAYTSALTLADEVGNYFLTTKGLLFCLISENGEYYWHITSDKYLLDATETLEAMADDAIITRQEKVTMRQKRDEIDAEYLQIKSTKESYDSSNSDNSKARYSQQWTSYDDAYTALVSLYTEVGIDTDEDYTFPDEDARKGFYLAVSGYNDAKVALQTALSESYAANEFSSVLAEVGADGILTPAEKRSLEKEWQQLMADRSNTVAVYTALGMVGGTYNADIVIFVRAFGSVKQTATLLYYMAASNADGGLNLITAGTDTSFKEGSFDSETNLKHLQGGTTDPFKVTIDSTTYEGADALNRLFKQYFDALAVVKEDIQKVQKGLADNAQSTADAAAEAASTAQTAANDAQTAASEAQSAAETATIKADAASTAASGAVTRLDNMASDSVITKEEKVAMRSLMWNIEKEYAALTTLHKLYKWNEECRNAWEDTTAGTGYKTAYTLLDAIYTAITTDLTTDYKFGDGDNYTASAYKSAIEDYSTRKNNLRTLYSAADNQWASMTFLERFTAAIYDNYVYKEELSFIEKMKDELIADKADIDNRWEEVCSADQTKTVGTSTYKTLYDNYVTAYKKLLANFNYFIVTNAGKDTNLNTDTKQRVSDNISDYSSTKAAFLSAKADYTAEFGTYRNELSNYLAYSNGEFGFVEKSGIVTKSNMAEVFATEDMTWTDDDGTTHTNTVKAEIKAEVDNGVSSVRIGADQIELEGYTTINGGFAVDEEGNMSAESGTFGGFTQHQWRVIHAKNYLQYGYIWKVSDGNNNYIYYYHFDIEKTGCMVLLIDKNVNQLSDKDDSLTCYADSIYAQYVPGSGYSYTELPSYNSLNNPENWKDSLDVVKAQQILGNTVTIINKTPRPCKIKGAFIVAGASLSDYNYTEEISVAAGEICVLTSQYVPTQLVSYGKTDEGKSYSATIGAGSIVWAYATNAYTALGDRAVVSQKLFFNLPTFHASVRYIEDHAIQGNEMIDITGSEHNYLVKEWYRIQREFKSYSNLYAESSDVDRLNSYNDLASAYKELLTYFTTTKFYLATVDEIEYFGYFCSDDAKKYGCTLNIETVGEGSNYIGVGNEILLNLKKYYWYATQLQYGLAYKAYDGGNYDE